MSTASTIPAGSFQTGHVGINVTDLDRSIAFYCAVFGFKVLGEGTDPARRYSFLGDGDRLILTLWQQADARFSPRQAGLHHLAFQVDSIDGVRDAEQRVRALGAHLHHDGIVLHAEGARSGGIFFDDPDGTRLEIYTPSGADRETATVVHDGPSCGFF
jgi:catechol 2,3-dioxygenase-like lactoylglutathione lyase family enzyme